jgi:hypothetical protein
LHLACSKKIENGAQANVALTSRKKNCDSFTNENLSENRKNPNASLILRKHQWVGRGEGMGGRVSGFGMVPHKNMFKGLTNL